MLIAAVIGTSAGRAAAADGPVMACDVPGPGCGDKCCPEGGPSSPPGVDGGTTSNQPVYFLEGAAIERETDLTLPGPGFTWSLTRSYSSGFVMEGGGELDTPLGYRWSGSGRGPYLYDHSGGFVSHLDVVFSASSKRAFIENSGAYDPPRDYNATLVKTTVTDGKDYDKDANSAESVDIFTLTESDTGVVYIFGGFDSATAVTYRGRLVERTTRAYLEDGKDGEIYSYNSDKYVTSIIPPDPQDTDYSIDFTYYTSGSETGRLQKVELSKSAAVIAKVEYTYFGNVGANSDLGSTGDLIQVKVSQKASGDAGGAFSIVRYTQYRYYTLNGSERAHAPGEHHQLKWVFESDAIQRAINYSENDEIDSPEDLLGLGDTDKVDEGGDLIPLKTFASRGFTYYVSVSGGLDNTVDTDSSHTTAWGSEILSGGSGKYGGSNMNEAVHPFTSSVDYAGMVKTETINGACASCGSFAPGSLRRDYYYIRLNSWQYGAENVDQANAASFLAIEDTVDSSGTARFRRIYATNHNGVAVREALTDNPASISANNVWCRSSIYDGDWRVLEQRMPSAHKGEVTTASELKDFLNPYDPSGNSFTNDVNTVSSTDGVVYYYEYNADGYPTGKLVRRGAGSGSRYYVEATDWTNYGTNGKINYLPAATYTYPAKTATRSAGKQTSYSYAFWSGTDDTVIKTHTTTLPTISTGENGSGAATTTAQHFDKAGRLRWTLDGEGYVNYHSYHPTTGGLAYTMVDVNNPASPGTDITSGSSGKWMAWTVDGADSNYPTRGSGLPSGSGLVTKHEFDDQARPTLTVDRGGIKHFTVYEDNRTLRFPSWDATNNRPLTPIAVVDFNDANQITASYSVDPARTAQTSGVPTGLSASTGQSYYTAWTRRFYSRLNGQHVKTLRYHDIPSSGDGTHITNYYVTAYDYDALGRRKTTYQTVENASGVLEQIERQDVDFQDRVTSTSRVVSPTGHSLGLDTDADADLGTISLPTSPALTTVSTTEYDAGSVGDGHITKQRKYHTTTVYTDTTYHRTFRGFPRGLARSYFSGSASDVSPFMAMDVDWMGRAVESAVYTTAPTWSSLTSGDGDSFYVPSSSGRIDRLTTMYDGLGRVYCTESYPGTSTNKLQANNYYDRRDNLVCSGDKYSAHKEYAYDGAGRRYAERTVTDVAATKYVSGAFQYRHTRPSPALPVSSTTGDDGLLQVTHTLFDAAGNAISVYTAEINHTDANGIDLDASSSYTRTTVHNWYDGAHRLIATADYGAGQGDATSTTWKNSTLTPPSRPSTALTWTDSAVYDGHALLTTYGYEAVTGRRQLVTAGVRKNGSDTIKNITKTFYDDLSRRLFVVEAWDGTHDPTAGSPSSNDDDNRVTGWTYNGLDQVVTLKPYNGSSAQTTRYFYNDAYHASLVTHTIYPDSSETTASDTAGSDQVKRVYNLDGSLNKLTDQRAVVHEYAYNSRRQLELDGVTSLGSSGIVDGAVRSIKRLYDSRGRLENIYSYPNSDGTGTALNRINNFYYDAINSNIGMFWFANQWHDAITPGAVADLINIVDDGAGIFVNGLRSRGIAYPGNNFQVNFEIGDDNPYANSNTIDDRLDRISGLEIDADGDTGGGGTTNQTTYKYNGTDRLVEVDYVVPDVRRQMFDATTNYHYTAWDRYGRTLRQQWDKYNTGAGVRDQYNYAYDYAGNRLSREIPSSLYATDNRDQVYGYDSLLRLNSMSEGTYSAGSITSGQRGEQWTLDTLGNWYEYVLSNSGGNTLIHSRVPNAANEITMFNTDVGSDWVDPVHDAAGNMTFMPQPVSPTSGYYLDYDAWNRLAAVRFNSHYRQKFEYDGLNRRIVRETYSGFSVLGETRHYYYNEQWQVIEEKVGATVSTARVDARYVWHPQYVDSLALRYWDSDDTGGPETYHYYLQDANYNVTAVANASGAVVERYAYTPYGEVTVLNGASDADGAVSDFSADANNSSDIENVVLYTGRERDPETRLQLNRNRYYAAHLGRWLTRDPAGYLSGLSRYQYTSGSPTRFFDPSGLAEEGPGVLPPPGYTGPWPLDPPQELPPVDDPPLIPLPPVTMEPTVSESCPTPVNPLDKYKDLYDRIRKPSYSWGGITGTIDPGFGWDDGPTVNPSISICYTCGSGGSGLPAPWEDPNPYPPKPWMTDIDDYINELIELD